MSIRTMRLNRSLTQEHLAEMTGLSLRTIQRVESGQKIGRSSTRTLAEFFEVDVAALARPENHEQKERLDIDSLFPGARQAADRLARHRALQLIIFVVTFFIGVFQWLAYLAFLDPAPADAGLGAVLSYVTQIAIAAAAIAYLFNLARVTFVWSYYATVTAFLATALGLSVWTQAFAESASYQLLFPVFFSLMLCALAVIHILQLALSLKGETAVLIRR